MVELLKLLKVFSTFVEVFLDRESPYGKRNSFLHVRGGVSKYEDWENFITGFSPRSWRCFQVGRIHYRRKRVFSTFVEVFLNSDLYWLESMGFLHVRGGVSQIWKSNIQITEFSPRSWRCSKYEDWENFITGFSPRSWRCFYCSYRLRRGHSVFSTFVEVFPIISIGTIRM